MDGVLVPPVTAQVMMTFRGHSCPPQDRFVCSRRWAASAAEAPVLVPRSRRLGAPRGRVRVPMRRTTFATPRRTTPRALRATAQARPREPAVAGAVVRDAAALSSIAWKGRRKDQRRPMAVPRSSVEVLRVHVSSLATRSKASVRERGPLEAVLRMKPSISFRPETGSRADPLEGGRGWCDPLGQGPGRRGRLPTGRTVGRSSRGGATMQRWRPAALPDRKASSEIRTWSSRSSASGARHPVQGPRRSRASGRGFSGRRSSWTGGAQSTTARSEGARAMPRRKAAPPRRRGLGLEV